MSQKTSLFDKNDSLDDIYIYILVTHFMMFHVWQEHPNDIFETNYLQYYTMECHKYKLPVPFYGRYFIEFVSMLKIKCITLSLYYWNTYSILFIYRN